MTSLLHISDDVLCKILETTSSNPHNVTFALQETSSLNNPVLTCLEVDNGATSLSQTCSLLRNLYAEQIFNVTIHSLVMRIDWVVIAEHMRTRYPNLCTMEIVGAKFIDGDLKFPGEAGHEWLPDRTTITFHADFTQIATRHSEDHEIEADLSMLKAMNPLAVKATTFFFSLDKDGIFLADFEPSPLVDWYSEAGLILQSKHSPYVLRAEVAAAGRCAVCMDWVKIANLVRQHCPNVRNLKIVSWYCEQAIHNRNTNLTSYRSTSDSDWKCVYQDIEYKRDTMSRRIHFSETTLAELHE